MSTGNDKIIVSQAQALPLGVTQNSGGIRFSLALPDMHTQVKLTIMQKSSQEILCEIPMNDYPAGGRVCAVHVRGLNAGRICYQYSDADGPVSDPYAARLADCRSFGVYKEPKERLLYEPGLFHFDWSEDIPPRIPFDSMILYKLHVRGFTKHPSSKVRHRGTFSGITEKLPYLKDLGVNAIELMPVMDFAEVTLKRAAAGPAAAFKTSATQHAPAASQNSLVPRPNAASQTSPVPQTNAASQLSSAAKAPAAPPNAPGNAPMEQRLNCWGYGDAQFFAPKSAYAYGDVQTEFCSMVRACHLNGIEVILEMLFVDGTPQAQILDCLRHWVLTYHVDGFHLNPEIVSMDMAVSDPVLSEIKLIGGSFDTRGIYGTKKPEYLRLAAAGEDFQHTMRCFLKGNDHCIPPFIQQCTVRDSLLPGIHFITSNNGFTLADLVAYNEKHNETNNEDNRDGTDYNNSWNCGAEGPTRSKKIRALRLRQMCNAMVLLIFQQGVPMLYAGDEFGNSQKGNNNAYCQDNDSFWLNWNDLKKNREFFEFVRALIQLRQSHPILHPAAPFRQMDYLSCGLPDLSLHGKNPWYPDYAYDNHYIGIMYCGHYAPIDGKNDDTFYFAYNMHWEPTRVCLPAANRGLRWMTLLNTAEANPLVVKELVTKENYVIIPERSIVIFIASLPEVEKMPTGAPEAPALPESEATNEL